MADILFSVVSRGKVRKIELIKDFLNNQGLSFDDGVEKFVIGRIGLDIVACGGVDGSVLKCICISESLRGQGLMLTLMSELLKLANQMQKNELFLFSKAENLGVFEQCGFCLVERVNDEIIFMQNANQLENFKNELSTFKKEGEKTGCIVMNANPFTLGHKHLVKEALKVCDVLHVFVVSEDASMFGFKARFKLVCDGLNELKNVFIHKGSDFIISKLTFPTYFLKDSQNVNSLYSSLDAQIFAHHIVPILGINYRFVGDEPFCKVTNEYNDRLEIECKKNGVNFIKIPRKKVGDDIISASFVRKLYAKNDFESLENLVPKTTLEFLKNMAKKESM